MSIRICARRLVAGGAIAAALGFVAPQAMAPVPDMPALIKHARISSHHNDDGTLKRGIRNEVETSNWSGYAVANFETGQTYTEAKAVWTVPKVSYVSPPPVCHVALVGTHSSEFCTSPNPQWEYSSSWVGIGGYCENKNCTTVDQTLIQLGTEQDVSSSGSTEYYAWIELLPNDPIVISPEYPNCNALSCADPVHPGDVINASLSCTSNCTRGANQVWTLNMSNTTRGWTFSTKVTYASSLLSAVWIQEAPSSFGGVLPLANFVTADFDPTVGAGAAPDFPLGATTDAILMVDPYGETSNPSIPAVAPQLDAFNTCWGNNASSIASCEAP